MRKVLFPLSPDFLGPLKDLPIVKEPTVEEIEIVGQLSVDA